MTNKIHLIFSSNYSLGRSTLTLEPPKEINHLSPISIFSIAKTHNLDEVNIRDKDFGGFISAFKSAEKLGKPFYFGVKTRICNSLEANEDDRESSSSYISLWIDNTQGYTDAIKLLAKGKGGLIDWKILKDYFTSNLSLTIPFYNSFLAKNILKSGNCIPDFGGIKPEFEISEMEHPFDEVTKEVVLKYCESNKFNLLKTHLAYHYSSKQFKSYQIFRINSQRKFFKKGSENIADDKQSFTNPGLDFFCSRAFSFEKYCLKTGIPFSL